MKRTLWRVRNRGLLGTLKQTSFFSARFLQCSTPRKVANYWLAKLHKVLRSERLISMPYRYTIDPTNICNLRCPLCPTGLGIIKRGRGFMELDTFKRLVNQIAPWAYLLELYNWGEPFLHPRIFEMIGYAHDHNIVVRLSSNLNHFSRHYAMQTVESGLDAIIVSIDGATEESYQRYRQRGRLGAVLQNLRYLLEVRKEYRAENPLVIVRCLVNRYNEGEIRTLREMVLRIGVDVFTVGDLFIDTASVEQQQWLPSDPQNSAYRYGSSSNMTNVWNCSDLWESMVINWDGGVAPCCWIHHAAHDFANALERPIREIWNGEAYRSARRVFGLGGLRVNPQEVICSRCRGRPNYLRM